MRRNLLFKNLGVAVAVAAFAFVACDDSSSAPETSGLDYSSDSAALSSSDEQGFSSSGDDALSSSGTDNPISSSLIAESSSSFLPKSSANCLAMDTSCGWTAEQLCDMGQERYCILSSSSHSWKNALTLRACARTATVRIAPFLLDPAANAMTKERWQKTALPGACTSARMDSGTWPIGTSA